MITDTQFIKIHGISEKGFFMRLIETVPYRKILTEIFVDMYSYGHASNLTAQDIPKEMKRFYSEKKWRVIEAEIDKLIETASHEFQSTFRGSLMIWKHDEQDRPINFPLVDIPVHVEHTRGAEIDDEVVRKVYDAQNKLQGINALFESVLTDLEFVFENHIDDKSAQLARRVYLSIKTLHEMFEEETFEPLDKDWRHHSLSGVLYALINTNTHTQGLAIPNLRKECLEIVKYDETSDSEKEREYRKYLDYTRKQFELDENWG